MPRILAPAHEAALRRFVYVGEDRSLLYKYALSPLAQWCVDALTPAHVAPNLITVVGLLPSVAVAAAAFAAAPGFDGAPVPRALSLAAAAAMFFYSTLDNMDGKQARKTRTSSALGLLLDHGCDSINAALVSWVTIALAVGARGGSWQLGAWWLIPNLPFLVSTWEEFNTGAGAREGRGAGGRARARADVSPSARPPSLAIRPLPRH